MSHTEYSARFVQYSSVFLGLEEALGGDGLGQSSRGGSAFQRCDRYF
jgi:hypothetical protein